MIKNQDERIKVATFSAPHGVRGLVKLRTHTEAPDAVFAFAPLTDASGQTTYRLERKGQSKGQWIVAVDGCNSREQAEELRGVALYAPASALPEIDETDAYYARDMAGLEVRTPDGQPVGIVHAVHNFGAGDLLEIIPKDGKSFMVVFDRRTIPEIDISAGYLVYDAPEVV